ncbi:lytic transglycosylase domain-containing protein [Paracidovorax anthurii]|uniref:Transglycosylase-like protein with SLT domain n=1 Tax=Paracidovorax anthurii TaxID=78229 RepID=A0A328YHG1_9BURK|nr:lytic transglycosylase domain-containing protein [Paracidovorax anthurii]RAR72714.1 transglycosylase-like protein with SLT domain [Paracidovorax anthurii]
MARPVRWVRGALKMAVLGTFAAGCGAAEAGAYDCQLPGGSALRVLGADIAKRFPSIGSSCHIALWIPAPEPQPEGAAQGSSVWPEVRVIHAPAPRYVYGAPVGAYAAAPGMRWPADGVARGPGISAKAEALAPIIESAAQRHAIDPHLVRAVIQVESAYSPRARSPKGAMGLMQLMPATAARFGANTEAEILTPAVNVDVGVRYLRFLADRFDGRTDLVLAAYNAGEGAVIRHGYRIPPYRETRDYVRKVLDLYPPTASR